MPAAARAADGPGVLRFALPALIAAATTLCTLATPADAALPCLDLVGTRTCATTPAAFPKSQAACAGRDTPVTAARLRAARRATLCLLNVERARRGLTPLRASSPLRRAATTYSGRMVRGRFFAHVSPRGDTLRDRVKRTSYLDGARAWTLGENLAWGGATRSTPASIVASWMRSPGHRRNVLDRAYAHVGVGVVTGTPKGGRGGTYTTHFGSRR